MLFLLLIVTFCNHHRICWQDNVYTGIAGILKLCQTELAMEY